MNAVVVYESVYGNTRAVAEAVSDGLGGADVLPSHEAADRAGGGSVGGRRAHSHGTG
jgi:flavodoxin